MEDIKNAHRHVTWRPGQGVSVSVQLPTVMMAEATAMSGPWTTTCRWGKIAFFWQGWQFNTSTPGLVLRWPKYRKSTSGRFLLGEFAIDTTQMKFKVCPDSRPSDSKPGYFWSRFACITETVEWWCPTHAMWILSIKWMILQTLVPLVLIHFNLSPSLRSSRKKSW